MPSAVQTERLIELQIAAAHVHARRMHTEQFPRQQRIGGWAVHHHRCRVDSIVQSLQESTETRVTLVKQWQVLPVSESVASAPTRYQWKRWRTIDM